MDDSLSYYLGSRLNLPDAPDYPDDESEQIFVEAETFEELMTLLDTHDFSAIAPQIKSLLLPQFEIVLSETDGKSLPIGSSKMGGFPDLPDSIEWPVNDGRAMSFLMQINLSELFEKQGTTALPTNGLLYFFIDYLTATDGLFSERITVNCKVCYFEDQFGDGTKELTRQSGGDYLPKTYPSCAITYRPEQSLPSSFSDLVPEQFDLELFNTASSFLDGYSVLPGQEIKTKLLGYPDLIAQDDVSSDGACLLLQIDSIIDLGLKWGNNGRLYFMIDENDLSQSLFDHVSVHLQDC